MVQWVVGSILHDGPTELFFVPASAITTVFSCLWNGEYKRTLAANQTE